MALKLFLLPLPALGSKDYGDRFLHSSEANKKQLCNAAMGIVGRVEV
jgi:hypothetical protein